MKKKPWLKSAYAEMKFKMLGGGPPLKQTGQLKHSINDEFVRALTQELMRKQARRIKEEIMRRCYSGHRHETIEGRVFCDRMKFSV